MADVDNITAARLDGTARRLLETKTPEAEAVAELHAISSDPRILGIAAGSALGAWQANPAGSWQGKAVAGLLTAAGGDEAVRDETAARVKGRLETYRRGIGG